MERAMLNDEQWDKIASLIPGKESDCGVTAQDNRRFLEAVLWINRTGSPWRDLPKQFGPWCRVYVRYNRWAHKGQYGNGYSRFSLPTRTSKSSTSTAPLRASISTAHQKNEREAQGQGRSRGGLTTKIHAAVDAFLLMLLRIHIL